MKNVTINWDGERLSVSAVYGFGGGYTNSRVWSYETVQDMLDGDISESSHRDVWHPADAKFPVDSLVAKTMARNLLMRIKAPRDTTKEDFAAVSADRSQYSDPAQVAQLATVLLRRQLSEDMD